MSKQEERNTSSVKMSDFKNKNLLYVQFSFYDPENAEQNRYLLVHLADLA